MIGYLVDELRESLEDGSIDTGDNEKILALPRPELKAAVAEAVPEPLLRALRDALGSAAIGLAEKVN